MNSITFSCYLSCIRTLHFRLFNVRLFDIRMIWSKTFFRVIWPLDYLTTFRTIRPSAKRFFLFSSMLILTSFHCRWSCCTLSALICEQPRYSVLWRQVIGWQYTVLWKCRRMYVFHFSVSEITKSQALCKDPRVNKVIFEAFCNKYFCVDFYKVQYSKTFLRNM